MTREKEIENFLRNEIKKIGGRAYKWVSPGNSGVPDRICVLPRGHIFFVELKAPGKKTRPLQDMQIRNLEQLGHSVYVVDSREQIREVIESEKIRASQLSKVLYK